MPKVDRPLHGRRVAVVGAGIAGLTSAWRLAQAGADVHVLEASERPFGAFKSVLEDGWAMELGPNTMPDRAFVLTDIIDELGIHAQQVRPREEANTRFVLRDGALVCLPRSPQEFVSSGFLSPLAKVRLFAEAALPRFDEPEVDESLGNFIRRRFGEEVLDYAIDPFVAGTYAGNPNQLSAQHVLGGVLKEFEEQYGSVLRGGIARAAAGANAAPRPSRPGRKNGALINFRGGVQTLAQAMLDALGAERLTVGARVSALHQHSGGRWTVRAQTQGGEHFEDVDGVVLAVPAYAVPHLEIRDARGHAVDTSAFGAIEYPPITLLSMGFREQDVKHPLDGFGLLVPEVEGRDILGAAFVSSIFEGRAPEGCVLMTVFIGGSRQPELSRLGHQEKVELALDELDVMLGVRGRPVVTRSRSWERAIPQYEVGYDRILSGVEDAVAQTQNMVLTGNYLTGISVSDTISNAERAAQRMASSLHPSFEEELAERRRATHRRKLERRAHTASRRNASNSG
ncbi:MAG: protoporphyrinogen oxidase, partial [Myxococcota bacterium]